MSYQSAYRSVPATSSRAITGLVPGYAHIARTVKLDDGRLIVNPGSVGLPAYGGDRPQRHVAETGSPHER